MSRAALFDNRQKINNHHPTSVGTKFYYYDNMNELEELYIKLDEVRNTKEGILPEYGYCTREEMISFFEEEIKRLGNEVKQPEYTEEEYERELDDLCYSQGISRYA